MFYVLSCWKLVFFARNNIYFAMISSSSAFFSPFLLSYFEESFRSIHPGSNDDKCEFSSPITHGSENDYVLMDFQ